MKTLIHNLQDPSNLIGFAIILISLVYTGYEIVRVTIAHFKWRKQVKQMYIDMDQE